VQEAQIEMKNGSVYRAPLWYFKPQEGFLTVQDEDGTLLRFRNMVKATLVTKATDKVAASEVDLIKKAKAEGWDGS
jgi:hypothetical protein